MRFINNPGSEVRIIRSLKIFDDGHSEVVAVGQDNIQEYIQSFEPMTNVSVLVQRFYAGDQSAISVNTPLYGDFTTMPNTLSAMQQKIIDGQRLFDSLPSDIRIKFDNDLNKFLAASVTPEFPSLLGLVKNDNDLGGEKVDE